MTPEIQRRSRIHVSLESRESRKCGAMSPYDIICLIWRNIFRSILNLNNFLALTRKVDKNTGGWKVIFKVDLSCLFYLYNMKWYVFVQYEIVIMKSFPELILILTSDKKNVFAFKDFHAILHNSFIPEYIFFTAIPLLCHNYDIIR